MSQSSRRHATAEARKLWRLAGDIACLLMHGDLHRPQAFANTPAIGHARVFAALSTGILTHSEACKLLSNPAPHDYSAHVRTHFEHLRALIFLGEPFDGERLEISLEETQWRRELPRLVEIRLALQKHPLHQLTQPEPSPQLRRKLREARPALSDATRRDLPAYWVANAFTSRAAAVLGADHPLVQRHEEAVRTAVLTPLRTVDGPNPRTRTRARPGPNRDAHHTFRRDAHHTFRRQYSQELTRALLTARGGVAAPRSFLAAHPGVDSFELREDYRTRTLGVTYRGAADPRELEEQLGEVVPAHAGVRASKLSPTVVAATFPPAD